MQQHINHGIGHLKLLLTAGATHVAGINLEAVNSLASTGAYVCGAIASITVAYYHIKQTQRTRNTQQTPKPKKP